jgi:hypothetical protein
LPEKQTKSSGPKQDLPVRLSSDCDFRIHQLEKIVGGGREKGSILKDHVKCVLHIGSEVKIDTFVNSACSASQRVCFEKYHSVMRY